MFRWIIEEVVVHMRTLHEARISSKYIHKHPHESNTPYCSLSFSLKFNKHKFYG
ncbi:hypothetical protein HanHA300_Chr09g0342211 [Helianthus annuus]|nr:hypothetical protein HanHA300_Chr09g0342211 [Helianthus annuus]